jgi:hypothetical protein
MTADAGEHRPSASAASPGVSGRLFLGGLLPSRARLRFAGLASVRPSTIPPQSTPVNLSSFSCLTHGVQLTALRLAIVAANTAKRRNTAKNSGGTAIILAVLQIAERSAAEESRGGGDVDR